jgi:hypothetical protein
MVEIAPIARPLGNSEKGSAGPLLRRLRYFPMAESYQRDAHPVRRFTGFRHHAKVHSFRMMTVILAWLMIAAAFYERPELLTALQRGVQRAMEAVGDTIPSPWGPRMEIVFREIGGFIWLQVTVIVILLRVCLSGIAGVWRLLRRRDSSTKGTRVGGLDP